MCSEMYILSNGICRAYTHQGDILGEILFIKK